MHGNNSPKVALVHDWLVSRGGGERVLRCLHEMYPDAPIYTLVYDEVKAPEWVRDCDVRTTYIQKWPGGKSHHKLLLSFMPKAWEALDLTDFDIVISSCSSCCKGVMTRPDAVHVCYCHSPIRYVWDLYYDYLQSASPIKRAAMRVLIHGIRQWDYIAAQRVDHFVANSEFVAKRIKKYYRRECEVIHPGAYVPKGLNDAVASDYYLVVSRFVQYKRIDLAIEACNRLKRRLVVIGSGGEEEEKLRQLAGPTVEFRGGLSDEEMRIAYMGARAFLFPGVEDYGLTPVEAMGYGVPVLAYAEGGALETVSEGETGLFFCKQTVDSLCDCINRFEQYGVSYSRLDIHKYSRDFSEEKFADDFTRYMKKITEDN